MTQPAVRLTEWAGPGGASAAWPSALVEGLASGLARHRPPGVDIVVGLSPVDDAAVVRLPDEVASLLGVGLVSTIDGFPPMVDDPHDYGAIVTAHACGNVLAMGARVLAGQAIVAFPVELGAEVVAAVCEGVADTLFAAGGALVGGHTVRSGEPILGVAVQGIVAAGEARTRDGAQPGDVLVISKRVGTGLVLAGGTPDDRRRAVASMCTVSRAAAQSLARWGDRVHALTDVGSSSLVGAAWSLARGSGYRVAIDLEMVPAYRGALAAAEAGSRAVGADGNAEFLAPHVTFERPDLPAAAAAAAGTGTREPAPGSNAAFSEVAHEALVFDPQTAGGLLAALDPQLASAAVDAGFVVIGEVGSALPGVTLLSSLSPTPPRGYQHW